MKRSPLKSNPAKVREWQDRTRDTMLGHALGREGQRSADLRRGVSVSGAQVIPEGQAIRATGTDRGKQPPVRFKARTPARLERCARCGRQAHGWHHLLPQQHIRVYVRGLRLPDPQARRLLRRLLSDPRNLTPLDTDCHAEHEARVHPLTRSEVPAAAVEFASELGPSGLSGCCGCIPTSPGGRHE